MNFALLTNVLCMILSVAVLVQSVRMMRSLRTVKDGALTDVVTALDKATSQARLVLSDMKKTLGTDAAANARLIEQARELRDELNVMIGMGDATAERISEAAAAANRRSADLDLDAEDELVDDIRDASGDEDADEMAANIKAIVAKLAA